ncbi:helix-turn-helix domain-containing protein [Nocardiopsis exhalans]|uniref:Helix-turn-helix domain-containing protein n=1 Tax=Nocardiopsis exhalans TaxID=163604 RepID=A0ABY5D3L1_9ACTN|nr:helix-turn-helix transcriptional regulator [Nocardiopsis exhalans]USY18949.1 helix-turn-helix domain-containing protein [Nocardiopsis exhalans]
MQRPHSPTIRLRRLGFELRRLRETHRLTLEEASKSSGVPRTTLSKIETAESRRTRTRDLDALADLYEVSDETRAAFHQLYRESKEKGWWYQYKELFGTSGLPAFEVEASLIRTYEAQVIPGLLQTADYARAVFTGTNAFAEEEIKRHVEARMERQSILTRLYPPEYAAIIDEAALRRCAGGKEAMREQLLHLAHMATRPNISIHALPFSAGMHAANLGGFQIMEFSEAADPTVGYAETPTYCVFVEGQDEIRTYDAMWREAHNASLTVAQTIDFIYELSASLEDVT